MLEYLWVEFNEREVLDEEEQWFKQDVAPHTVHVSMAWFHFEERLISNKTKVE